MKNLPDIKVNSGKLSLVFFYFICATIGFIYFFYYSPNHVGDFKIIFYFFIFVGFFTIFINLRRSSTILNAVNFIVVIYLFCFCFRTIFLFMTDQSHLFHRLNIQIYDSYTLIYKGVVLALISMTFILIGYTIFIKDRRINLTEFHHLRIYMGFSYVFIGAGVLLWLLWVFLNGGHEFLLATLKNPYAMRTGGYVPRFGLLRWGVYIGSVFVYANVILEKKLQVFDILLFLFYGLIIYSLKCSVSETVLYFLGAVIVYDIAVKRLRPVRTVFILFLLFSIVVFLKIRLNLSYNEAAGIEASDSFKSISHSLVGGSKFAGIDVFTMIVSQFPDRLDYIYGRSLIDGIIKVMPSINKITTGTWLNRIILDTEKRGNNPTLPGIFYLNFGVPGIVFFSFLFGWFCAVVENYVMKRPSLTNILFYTVTLVFFIIFMSRTGAVTVALKKYVYMLGGLFLYHVIPEAGIKISQIHFNRETYK